MANDKQGKGRQAVLLIHGIGEQKPMDTLRGFVDAVWSTDKSVHNEYGVADVWSKPDTISESFELRRLTTGRNRNNVRTDFFEFYWSHLMPGTELSHVVAWARLLLLRAPWTLPPQLRGAWAVLVGLIGVIAFFAWQTVVPEAARVIQIPTWLNAVATLITTWGALPVIKNVIGDAARYLHPAPSNIHRRQEIRTKGVKLLQKLHEAGYERIIVAGHSLGSVIGYDILTYAWALHYRTGNSDKPHPKLDEIEQRVSRSELADERYHAVQRDLFREFVNNGNTWRVTDFLTLGSPLAHATVLLADGEQDLRRKQSIRELPTSPPTLEKNRWFSYPHKEDQHRTPHHGAVFAPTRWTNLYFPSRFVIRGDLIGGPLAQLFGRGVRDVEVSTRLRAGFLGHTLYWSPESGEEAASHIKALRNALNLLDSPTPESTE